MLSSLVVRMNVDINVVGLVLILVFVIMVTTVMMMIDDSNLTPA